jgi:transposase-like protein
MPAKKQYTSEFKEQSVRFVPEHIDADESRYGACQRLGSKLDVKLVALYDWVKIATPRSAKPPVTAGWAEELKTQLAAVRKENRELARANQILQDAAIVSGRRSTVNHRSERVCGRSFSSRGRADLPFPLN